MMTLFNQCKAVKQLKELAEKKIDLSKEGVLSTKRLEQMTCSIPSLKLFYGTERVTEKVMKALFDLAQEMGAVEKMKKMQDGEIVNQIEGVESEKRAVLHTAMRAFFDSERKSEIAQKASRDAYSELEKLKSFLDEVDKQEFTEIVQVGIGGSELGPKAVFLALKSFSKPHRHAHFISNVDPDDTASVLDQIDLSKTLVVVVSKSGTTLETRTNEQFIRKKFLDLGLSPKHHLIAITCQNSPMDDAENYRACFYIWDFVGGRYSVTSMVGCVVLAFTIGMEKLLEFLQGAHALDKVALSEDPNKNLPLLSALLGVWNHNFLNLPTTAIIPYSQALSRFTAHLQQCDMESNGKQIDRQGQVVDYWTGPIIWGEIGTNSQHSFYQLIHQGTHIVPIEFIGFCESQNSTDYEYEGTTSQEKLLSNLFAQSIGLAQGEKSENPNQMFWGNRPTRLLMAKQCNPYTMGAILAFYEHKIAFQGFIWNINSFDQEGVELGKVLANKIINQFAKKRKKEEFEKDFPLGTFYLNQIENF